MRRRLFALRRTDGRAVGRACGGRISMLFRLLFVPLSSSSSPLSDLLIESRPQFPSFLPSLHLFHFPLSFSFCSFHRIVGPKYITDVAARSTLKSRPLRPFPNAPMGP